MEIHNNKPVIEEYDKQIQSSQIGALVFKIILSVGAVISFLGTVATLSLLLPQAQHAPLLLSFNHATSVVAATFGSTSLNVVIFSLCVGVGISVASLVGYAFNKYQEHEYRQFKQTYLSSQNKL